MYHQKQHYSDRDLLIFKIHDMQVEINCAKRDGLLDYAKQCEKKLNKLKEELNK